MLQSLLNGCRVLPQARCACYGLLNDRRLCLLQYVDAQPNRVCYKEAQPNRMCYKDTQPGKVMLQRGTTWKDYATKTLRLCYSTTRS